MDRKLASIQRIVSVEPIPEADAIEKVTVLGWHCVAKKGEFKAGDLCVYCEVDSVLPEKPEFEFLKDRGYRIKTIKLRGQVSQGICFPLSIFAGTGKWTAEEGDDVTEELGVTKWEPKIPVSMSGKIKGSFPGFIPKTDETRIQSIPDLLERHSGTYCYVTEKVDGSSCTIFWKDGEIGVCSRNMWMQDTEENVFWSTVKKLGADEKLKKWVLYNYPSWRPGIAEKIGVALQGELLGPGIQGNKYNLKDHKILWFNFFWIDHYKFMDSKHFYKTVQEEMGLETVPLLYDGFVLNNTVDELVEMSKGQSQLNKIHREGIVIRPCEEKEDRKLGRVSFKVINPDFLLKFGE